MKKKSFLCVILLVCMIVISTSCTKNPPLPKQYSKEVHDIIKSQHEFSKEDYSQIIEWYSTSFNELYDSLDKCLEETENVYDLQENINTVFDEWGVKWPDIEDIGSTIGVFGSNNAIWDEIQKDSGATNSIDKYLLEQMGEENFNKVIKLREDIDTHHKTFTQNLNSRLEAERHKGFKEPLR